jgi:hypothetical protein
MKTLATSLLALGLIGAVPAEQTPIDYRFDEVRRTVRLMTSNQELQVERGSRAHGGDKVRTGFFSYALIASDRYRARFEIFSSTNVLLAQGTPGVILSLERGRLRAAFDKITGNEPRIVQTPGALLAVRGTKYDVEVDNGGRTTVDVWEGVVEVQSQFRPEPLLVHAGEESTFARREPPQVHPMPDNRRMNDPNRRGPEPRGPQGGQQPPSRGSMPPPPPPNTPPPSKPPGGHH